MHSLAHIDLAHARQRDLERSLDVRVRSAIVATGARAISLADALTLRRRPSSPPTGEAVG
jgi:hypothetical protein